MESLQRICTGFEFLKNTWAFIREWYNYNELVDEKCQTLRLGMEALRCRENDVNDELRNLQYDSGKKRKRDVENWLQNTRQKITEVQVVEANAGSRRYLSRLHFLRNVEKNIQEVNELIEEGVFVEGLVDEEQVVFKLLKFSYDHLKHEKLQRCFLYCASFPKDYIIPRDELIVYWIAEGLLDERGTREAQYYMGLSILNKLENVCLLESVVDERPYFPRTCVKMHDVIRDMALKITKENGSAILEVKSRERSLHNTNEKWWSGNLQRVFLAGDVIEEYISPSMSPKCPRLLTLQLQYNNRITELPNSFLVHMQSLSVLVLSYMDKLERLPDSICNLKSLRGLFLNGCSNLEYVPSLGELTELRELHLHRSGVKAVPTGLKGLVNLKCLDISWVSRIQSIPTGLLPSLSNLQYLRLDGCNIDVQTEELITLRQIEMLGVNFSNQDKFNSYVCTKEWERLSHYHLQLRSGYEQIVNPWQQIVHPWLKCREVSIYSTDDVILLPTNMQQLNIVDGVLPTSLLDISPSLKENTCKDLEKCFIGYSWGLEDLWSFTTTTTSVPQNLQVLEVCFLPDLGRLFKYEGVEMGGRPPAESGTFSRLKVLDISDCGKLKYLLTATLVRHHMQRLELIRVCRCWQMEHIIIEEEEEGITAERNSIFTFPMLQTLVLEDVRKLKSICMGTKTMVCPSFQEINVLNCPRLKGLSLSIMNVDERRTSETQLHSPIKIIGRKEWWDLLEWNNPEVKSVLQFSNFEVGANSGSRRYFSQSLFLKNVDKNIQEVNELMEEGVFAEGLLIDVHQSGEALLTAPLAGQTTAERNFEKIWKFLMDDEMPCIGVFGMGGVGKTTVMTHIHNRLLESRSFADHVYWVTVSQESSIHKLQSEIAKLISLHLSEELDERRRAAMLFHALRRKKFVVILDDMWKVFLPEDIGIPVGVEAGRLLITTRSLEVCRGMQCQQSIKVEPLSKEEAWDLFKKNVWSDKVVDKKVEEIARSIAMECAGLPLAIVTTARSMRGVDDIHVWRSALVELREQVERLADTEEEVFKPLKFSYDCLKNEKHEQCFVYCASFPVDYKIRRMKLILYWIAEGLLDGMGTRKAQYDLGHTILNELENVGLLERAEEWAEEGVRLESPYIYVKMRDVIRDMALNITKGNCSAIFEVKSGEGSLHIAKEGEGSENLERVFLEGDIIEEYLSVSLSPKCPRLLTLQLHGNNRITELPNSFFLHMQNLRVLVLSYMDKLKCLPDSISNLKSLRGLFLSHCSELRYVPSLAELKELRELHLHLSEVGAVPTGLKGLVNLKCLDLFGVFVIESFPTGLLSSLSNLQCLRLDGSNIDVQMEELITLRQIEMLGVYFSNLDKFNSYVCTKGWERLSHYHLQIKNSEFQLLPSCLRSRKVSISYIYHVRLLPTNIPVLPTNIQELSICDCVLPSSLLDFSTSLRENTCKELEKCYIGFSKGIEDLWSFTTTTSVPQNLQILTVCSLPDLRSLFKYEGVEMGGRPPAESGTFSHLKELKIYKCGKLKYLLTARLVRHHMQNIELIWVDDCSQMEHIIIEEEEEGITTERNSILTFSKLRTLKLFVVPELRSICKGSKTMVCPSLQEIDVFDCPKLKRLSLSTMKVDDSRTSETQLDSLIKIRGQKEWWDLLEWDNPEAECVIQFSILEAVHFMNRLDDVGVWSTTCYEEVM